jgi:hypothetical protein
MKRLVLALALTIAVAQPASAYLLSCGAFRSAVLSGDEQLLGVTVGHAFGVADMIAGLLCFGGDRRCGCLSNIGDRAEQFGEQTANAILACPAGDPAFGAVFNAVFDICR